MKKGNVLEIKDLSVDFMTVRGIVYAVQGVDLEVKQGEIHGIVGEAAAQKIGFIDRQMFLCLNQHASQLAEIALENGY